MLTGVEPISLQGDKTTSTSTRLQTPLKIILIALTLVGSALMPAAKASISNQSADFYVSPAGNDTSDGKVAKPGSLGHGPFATLNRARIAAARIRLASPNRRTPIIVRLRGGVYELPETVHFTSIDSGTVSSPTIYAAYGSEHPVLSGGQSLSGWQRNGHGMWECALPMWHGKPWQFSQMFVNDVRAPRPRLPERGYFRVVKKTVEAPDGSQIIRYHAIPQLLAKSITPDAEFVILQQWMCARLRPAALTVGNGTMRLIGKPVGVTALFVPIPGAHFFFDNVQSALINPGQWFADVANHRVLYIPKAEQNIHATSIIAPRLEQLISIDGAAPNQPVRFIEFHGLSFEHSNWNVSPTGFVDAQSGAAVPAAVVADGAVNCKFDHCQFRHLGGWAVDLKGHCRYDIVNSCTMTDLGAGGVKVGDPRTAPSDHDLTRVSVTNNLIAHGGRVDPSAAGIWVGQAGENFIAYNDVHDFYYSGISAGWTWGYGKTSAVRNIISFNRVSNIGQNVLDDLGGIYTLGTSTGTIISNNVVSDVKPSYAFGFGIYLDEGATGVTVTRNLVHDTDGAGFNQHYGMLNNIDNNIFAFGKYGQISRPTVEKHTSFTFQHNIVICNTGILQRAVWSSLNIDFDHNLYWRTDGKPVSFAHWTWDSWHAAGADIHSLIADPQFVNVAARDFRLKPTSPAARIGFVPFDPRKAGRTRGSLPDPDPACPSTFQAHDKP